MILAKSRIGISVHRSSGFDLRSLLYSVFKCRGGGGGGGSKPSGKDQKRAGPLWFSSLDCSRHNASSPDMPLPHLKVFVC